MSARALSSYVLMLLVVLTASPPYALARNLFSTSDPKNLSNANRGIVAIETDIIQASQASNQATEDHQKQVTCLQDIYSSLNDVSLRIGTVVDLVFLSSVMNSPADEKRINSLLAREVPFHRKQIATTRGEIINSSAYCSSSALVNTYAQKSFGLIDDATEAMSAIENQLTGATH
jgi:hypothetical protein